MDSQEGSLLIVTILFQSREENVLHARKIIIRGENVLNVEKIM